MNKAVTSLLHFKMCFTMQAHRKELGASLNKHYLLLLLGFLGLLLKCYYSIISGGCVYTHTHTLPLLPLAFKEC